MREESPQALVNAALWCEKQLQIKEMEEKMANLKKEQADLLPEIVSYFKEGERQTFLDKVWEFTLDPRTSTSYKEAIEDFKRVADDQHLVLIEEEVYNHTRRAKNYPKFKPV